MEWMIRFIINTLINTFVFITIVNLFFMGIPRLKFAGKSNSSCYMIRRENRIDLQQGHSCAGYAIAYVLRHHEIPASGEEIYAKLPHKTAAGDVYPKEIKKMLQKYGFRVKYCIGNLQALKNEVGKGTPVIVLIKVRKDKNGYIAFRSWDMMRSIFFWQNR